MRKFDLWRGQDHGLELSLHELRRPHQPSAFLDRHPRAVGREPRRLVRRGAIFGRGIFGSLIQAVIALAILYPSLAVAAKRFHDRDKSGWWILILFIPIIGFIWYLVELGF